LVTNISGPTPDQRAVDAGYGALNNASGNRQFDVLFVGEPARFEAEGWHVDGFARAIERIEDRLAGI
jgi:hypothetical protein